MAEYIAAAVGYDDEPLKHHPMPCRVPQSEFIQVDWILLFAVQSWRPTGLSISLLSDFMHRAAINSGLRCSGLVSLH
jgi:hypothetical protein